MPVEKRLPCTHRVRNRSDFDNVFKQQNRLYGRHFLAYYQCNQLPHPRIGIISSRRNVRLSVERSRIRRVLKEQFRLNQHALPKVDIVFIVKRHSEAVNNEELRICLEKMLKRLTGLLQS